MQIVTNKNQTSRIAFVIKDVTSLSTQEVGGLIPGPVEADTMSPAARYRCDVSL